jgi:hypothetical protein
MRILAALLFFAGSYSLAAERATIDGKVTDASGQPVAQATVLVYKAGVKKGYSTYCPTCYVDCGKRAVTGADGTFTLNSLSPDLLFTLLVVHDGHSTATVSKARSPIEDASRLVRGRVVDIRGNPLRGAVAEQQGVVLRMPNGQMSQRYGDGGWTDVMAVSNEKGEFEIAYGVPADKIILSVSARGMASKLFTEPTGADRKTMTVEEGATVRGRLMENGKPVANAEVGLISHSRRSGASYPEIRIGTQEDGTFAITNVPAGRVWLVYPKMDSLSARGLGAGAVDCETKDNGQEVSVGDIPVTAAHKLSGKVVLTDGKPIPEGMRMTLGADRAWDSQTVTLAPDGGFSFAGLPTGVYSLGPSVKGYELAEGVDVEALVNRDIDALTIGLRPSAPRAGQPR